MKITCTGCPTVPNPMRGTVGQARKMPIKALAFKVLGCPTDVGQTGQRVGQLDAPADSTGLDDWPEHPPEGVDFGAYESAGSLLDLCRRHGLRVEVTNGKARVIYPVDAPPALVEYAELLLAEGRSYILNMKNQVAEGPEVAQ